jgi:biopolymer transport protein ExbD
MSLERKRKQEGVKLNLSPMIDVVFLILIYFIVSLEMEPSLDDRLGLADARYSVKQEESALQIYVLKARLNPDGTINPDSTGLVAFADRAGTPDSCLFCGLSFKKEVEDKLVPDSTTWFTQPYVVETKQRLIEGGVPEIVDSNTGEIIVSQEGKPDVAVSGQVLEGKNKFCRQCGNNMLFVTLDMIPEALKKKREEIFEKVILTEDIKRANKRKPPLTEVEKERIKDEMPLMIKADNRTFYGRIIQVVEKAREVGITKFALVTSSESSWAQEHANLQGAYTKKLGSQGKN